MITAIIANTSTSVTLPILEQDFVNKPIENAVDIETLNGRLYTDFVNQKGEWSLSFDSLTEDEYNDIRAIYDSQFTEYDYPTLSIAYYSVEDVSVRMYINDKNIWNNCGAIQNVELRFREQYATGDGPSFLLLDDDSSFLLLEGTDRLVL